MAKLFDEITEHMSDWIGRQALFFVATAPLAGDGHVNVSPKGPIGSLAVLGPPGSRYLRIERIGHTPNWDDPELVARLLLEASSPVAAAS